MSAPPSSLRGRIAYEAARIMADQRLSDTRAACRRAALRLGCSNARQWPTPEEVGAALRAQQRLFLGAAQQKALVGLRTEALAAMEMFRVFRPHLVGPVLDGTADTHSPLELQLFVDDPSEVAARLIDLGIPWRDGEKPLFFPGGRRELVPVFTFQAGMTPVRLVVLGRGGLRLRPLAPGGRRPMGRADSRSLRRLMEQENSAPGE